MVLMWDDRRSMAWWTAGIALAAVAGLTWMLWLVAAEWTATRTYSESGLGEEPGEVVVTCGALLDVDASSTSVTVRNLPEDFIDAAQQEDLKEEWCKRTPIRRLALAVLAAPIVAVLATLAVIGCLRLRSFPQSRRAREAKLQRRSELSERLAPHDDD
jgi:hypothetical protein